MESKLLGHIKHTIPMERKLLGQLKYIKPGMDM